MSATIQIDAERGEIRVGGMPFECIASADGTLAVGGHPVRAITLGERDRLVAFTSDDVQRTRRIARMIADVATQTGNDRPTGELRAAIEAVALHLAGAGFPGALALTTLVLARAAGSFGDTVMELPAHEADRLADMLVASLPADRTGDAAANDGWTTINFDPASSNPASSDPARPGGQPHGPFAARDHLADLLLRRDRPIGIEIAALLLGTAPSGNAVAHGDDRVEASLDRGSTSDRWAVSASPSQAPMAIDAVDRWSLSSPAAGSAPGTDSAHAVDRRVTLPAARVETDGTRIDGVRPDSSSAVDAARPGSSASPHQAGRFAGARPSHEVRTAPTPPAAAAVDPGRWSPWGAGEPAEHRLAARSAAASDPLDGGPGSARLATRFRPSVLRPRDPQVAFDPDAIAVALHRAADLRGIA